MMEIKVTFVVALRLSPTGLIAFDVLRKYHPDYSI